MGTSWEDTYINIDKLVKGHIHAASYRQTKTISEMIKYKEEEEVKRTNAWSYK